MTFRTTYADSASLEDLVADCQAYFSHAEETLSWTTDVDVDCTVTLPDVPQQNGAVVITPETAALVAGFPDYGG